MVKNTTTECSLLNLKSKKKFAENLLTNQNFSRVKPKIFAKIFKVNKIFLEKYFQKIFICQWLIFFIDFFILMLRVFIK